MYHRCPGGCYMLHRYPGGCYTLHQYPGGWRHATPVSSGWQQQHNLNTQPKYATILSEIITKSYSHVLT